MDTAEQRHYCPVCNAVFRTPFSRCPLDGNKLAELEGDPLIDTTIDSRYLIKACIGEGGMGRVYLAKHTRMSRTYAIKILFGDHAGDTRMRSRFAREAEAVSRLSHGNVISVIDFGETPEGLLYLVMDLANGESLSALMAREAPLAPSRAIAILAQLAKGLAHAHGQGLVHRDFKGENVIMVVEEEREVPKIVDFGICMIIEDSPSATMLTSQGIVMGTPAVMAPEQASGDVVDHRTDLFSLGIVGYQMLSGCLPFEGSPLDMARKNLYEPIPPMIERSGVNVAPALEAIITKLTAKKPDERYQNAKDVLDDLGVLSTSAGGIDWNGATPLPAGEFVYGSNPGVTHPFSGVSSGVHSPPAVAQVDPMATLMVGDTEDFLVSARRRKMFIVGGVVVALLLVAMVIGLGGDDDAAMVATTIPDATSTSLSTSLDAGVKTAAVATPDATLEPPTKDETPIETVPANPIVEPTCTTKKRTKPPRNSHKKKPPKTPALSPEEKQKAARQKTRKLYGSVGAALHRLEQANGKAAVSGLRRDYNNISLTRLLTDASMQPEYHQRLLRLRAKIRASR